MTPPSPKIQVSAIVLLVAAAAIFIGELFWLPHSVTGKLYLLLVIAAGLVQPTNRVNQITIICSSLVIINWGLFAAKTNGSVFMPDYLITLITLIVSLALFKFFAPQVDSRIESAQIFNKANDAVFILSSQGTIKYCNLAATQVFEYSQQDLTGRHQSEVFTPFLTAQIEGFQASSDAESSQLSPHFHTQLASKNNQQNSYSASLSRLNSQQDTLLVLRDISAQKEFEHSIQQSESRLRLVLNSALDGVIMITEHGEVTEWNSQAEVIFGYTKKEVIGRPLAEFIIPEEYRQAHQIGLEKFRQNKEGKILNRRVELEALNKKRQRLPVELTILPIASINSFEFCAFVRDISERREAAKDQAHLSAIVQSTDVAIFSQGPDGRVTSWNKGAEKLFGYAFQDIVNQPISAIIPNNKYQEYENLFGQVSSGKLIKHFETERITLDQKTIDVSLTISPIIHPDGQIIGTSTIARDISSRKAIERILLRTNNALATSNKELQEFAFIASHDLREPLRKVISFGKLLNSGEYGELNDKGKNFLNYILDAAERMQLLLSSLLTYSRITSSQTPFSRVDLAQIVASTLEDLELSIQASNAHIEVGELPIIEGDPVQIRQLLQNLIENSLKYRNTAVEKTRIKISAKYDKPRKSCYIYINDNGIGFEMKYKSQIFEVFQRLHSRKEYQGNGMGLSICRKIVERHHGSIQCESKVGEGTTFIIQLPIEQLEIEAQ
ncbi:PAS domain S-box protein [Aliikangiella sp. IMCC44632]